MLLRTAVLLSAAALALASAGCDTLTRPRAIEIAAEPVHAARPAPAPMPAPPGAPPASAHRNPPPGQGG